MTIGEKITKLRKEQNLTQEQLAYPFLQSLDGLWELFLLDFKKAIGKIKYRVL